MHGSALLPEILAFGKDALVPLEQFLRLGWVLANTVPRLGTIEQLLVAWLVQLFIEVLDL